MKCPNCRNKMKYKDKGFWGHPFSTGPEGDYPEWIKRDVYTCKDCHIKKVNDKWTIPDRYKRPSRKQINAIYFINNYLDREFEPLLSVQCHRIIKKHLEEAAKVKQARDEQMYEEMCEWYGGDLDFF